MKAVSWTSYGPPERLNLVEMDMPVPGDRDVLVRVKATTVNRTDCAAIQAIPLANRIVTGLFKPKLPVPGTEFAGEIVAVGSAVCGFKIGDWVFGFRDTGAGSHAEYVAINAEFVSLIPARVSVVQSVAGIEGVHYAWNFINKVNIERSQHVIVNGAGGAIGSAAVQLVKHLGAEVTAVCSPRKIEAVRSLGADRVIDYTREDFTQVAQPCHYVFDCVGKSSFFRCYHLLLPGGVYISSDLGFLGQNIFLPLITPLMKPLLGGRKTAFPYPVDIPGSLRLLRKLYEQGSYRALIDREYPFDRIVDAYRYVMQGHKLGSVIVRVDAPR